MSAHRSPLVALVVAVGVGLASASTAQAQARTPLDSGELSHTAHTLSAGENRLTLGTAYSRGITDTVQVGSHAFGWFAGPNANVEYQFLEAEAAVMSGTVSGSYAYDGGYSFSVVPTFTLGGRDTSRLNVSVGYGRFRTTLQVRESADPIVFEGAEMPLRLSYDLVVGPQNTFRFLFNSDVQTLGEASPDFSGGVGWLHGVDRFRLGLGVVVTNYGIEEIETILATVRIDPNLPAVYPLPYIRMWWRF